MMGGESGGEVRRPVVSNVPIVFSFVGVTAPETLPWLFSSLSVIVDVDGERPNELARGPKWVSFSSTRE